MIFSSSPRQSCFLTFVPCTCLRCPQVEGLRESVVKYILRVMNKQKVRGNLLKGHAYWAGTLYAEQGQKRGNAQTKGSCLGSCCKDFLASQSQVPTPRSRALAQISAVAEPAAPCLTLVARTSCAIHSRSSQDLQAAQGP